MQLIRHLLFCPANKVKMFPKAINSIADLVVFDLEDSVPPSEKNTARSIVTDWLVKNPVTSHKIGIRINDLTSNYALEDLLMLSQSAGQPAYIMIPKVESSSELFMVEKIFSSYRKNPKLILLIETSKGINDFKKIIAESTQIAYAMIGNANLSAELNCTNKRDSLHFAYSKFIMDCSINKIPAIDSPYYNLVDSEGFTLDTSLGKEMGFIARAAIHPKQLSTIHNAYTPTEFEINFSKQVIEVVKKGVGVINGTMVDEAMALKAQRLLDRINE